MAEHTHRSDDIRRDHLGDDVRENARDRDPGAGEQAGEAVGGIGGTLAGAGIGSLAGPVGTIIGGIAGAVGGWWAGEKAGRAIENMNDEDDDYYRRRFESSDRRDVTYDDARVGYGVGHVAGHNPDYRGRSFDEVESDVRRGWRHERHDYESMRPYVREGYERSSRRERRD
ncbi:MAG TPA: hypothetical protein VFU06_00380 [Longimicrobiales bacterium]|nr:hypothetical protein [Longimicrobiales bacterium]